MCVFCVCVLARGHARVSLSVFVCTCVPVCSWVFVRMCVNVCVCPTVNILESFSKWLVIQNDLSHCTNRLSEPSITSVVPTDTAKSCSVFWGGGVEVLLWGRVFFNAAD